MKYICLIAVALALAVSPAFAQFYQYTDKNGNIVITDSPPSGAEVREKQVTGERVHRSTRSESDHPALEKKDDPDRAAQGEERSKKNYSRVSVVMYMTDW